MLIASVDIILANNEIVTNLFSNRNKARCHMKNAPASRAQTCIPRMKVLPIQCVERSTVPSVLHLQRLLSRINSLLCNEQYKRFKTWRSAERMRPIYDVNARCKMKFLALYATLRDLCSFVDTLIGHGAKLCVNVRDVFSTTFI